MKNNGDCELSDVPRLLERGGIKDLLGARAALVDAAEGLLNNAASEERSLKADEQRRFDEHTAQVRDITAKLAEHKRQRVADIVAAGLPAEYCRLPY
jgi:hypothetical protein